MNRRLSLLRFTKAEKDSESSGSSLRNPSDNPPYAVTYVGEPTKYQLTIISLSSSVQSALSSEATSTIRQDFTS